MARDPLYTKYRPKIFSDVVEQDAIKQILMEELETKQLKRVLLFTGGAGTGKTTTARIYANEIEPVSSNIIEINCADHTGVDDVRGLILEQAKSVPMVGKYKIFILDECHQFTNQSQNALLKILEEPPKYCIFILCTTDPQKVIPTVLSRAFRYDFQLISFQGILDRLLYILNAEQNDPEGCGVQVWDMEAVNYIARTASGHMRNAIALLDKVISYSKNITVDAVVKVLGVTSYHTLFKVLDNLLDKNQSGLIDSLEQVNRSGMDLKLFIKNFLSFTLDVNKYLILKSNGIANVYDYINIPLTYDTMMSRYSINNKDQVKHILTTLLTLNSNIKWETNVKPVLETNLLLEVL